jgi:GxxExxY protein
MPFECPIQFRPIPEAEFKKLDYEVMRHAFASHNHLGRLCDEAVYRNDMAARLGASGIGPVHSELPLLISHRDYRKRLFVDLAVADTVLFELKAVQALTGHHDKQILTYLFLAGATRGKLVNFRPASVEYRTINATVSSEEQRRFDFVTSRWVDVDERSKLLREHLRDLLDDWGMFLSLSLYEEALTHFLGGENAVLHRVPLSRDGLPLGDQLVHLLGETIGFHLTAFNDAAEHGETHVRRFLSLTPLQFLHWINISNHRIDLVTLKK